MSYLPEISCIICGAAIEEAGMNFSWRTHFRAVYVTQPAPTQAKLSGRGWRTSANGSAVRVQPGDAPPDHTSGCAHISLMPRTDLAADAAPPETRWGYAFHAACWRVLEEVCFPGKPDVQALWDACRAMPVDGAGVLNWGHDYGGAVAYVQRARKLLLGEERELEAAVGKGVHRCDPLHVAEIRDVLEEVRRAGDEGRLGDGPSVLSGSGEGEGFSKLPLEILQLILVNLHTPDVAALRPASRVYAAVPLHEEFWRSRFDRGLEYEHVFEARQPSAVPRGLWRSTYISLKAVSRQSAVRNRKRVWKLASSLQDLLLTMQDGGCEGDCSAKPADAAQWVHSMDRVDKPFFNRTITLPAGPLARLYVSTLDLHGRRYVSGLRIQHTDGGFLRLGYCHPGYECLLFSSGPGPCRIAGFSVARDWRGVRGIRGIFNDGKLSRWAGDHRAVSFRSQAFVPTENVAWCLTGGFDTLKLIELSISAGHEIQQEPGGADP